MIVNFWHHINVKQYEATYITKKHIDYNEAKENPVRPWVHTNVAVFLFGPPDRMA
jgi:hypothetical protein